MKCRALRLPAALAGLLLALSLCACGAGEEQGFAGEVLQISDAEVPGVGSAQRSPAGPGHPGGLPPGCHRGTGKPGGHRGGYRHGGLPRPGHAGGTGHGGRRECGLLQKEFCGVIDRIGEGTAVIEPLATEEIAQEAQQLSISLQPGGGQGVPGRGRCLRDLCPRGGARQHPPGGRTGLGPGGISPQPPPPPPPNHTGTIR